MLDGNSAAIARGLAWESRLEHWRHIEATSAQSGACVELNEGEMMNDSTTTNQTTALDTVTMREVETPVIDPAMFDRLNDMPEGFSLQSAYLKFDKQGQSERVFFVGFTEIVSRNKNSANGMTPAAVFMWKDPADGAIKRVINAGDNLVKQLQNLPYNGQPIPVKVTYLGEKRAGSGNNFKAFDVVVLGAPTGDKKPTDQPKTARQLAHEWATKTRATVQNEREVREMLNAWIVDLGLTKPTGLTMQGAVDWLKEQTAN